MKPGLAALGVLLAVVPLASPAPLLFYAGVCVGLFLSWLLYRLSTP